VSWIVSGEGVEIIEGCEETVIDFDTTGVTLTCTAQNEGGGSSESLTVKRDATPPVVTVTGVAEGARYPLSNVPNAGCTTTDTMSGVKTEATLSVSGGEADGTGNFTANCAGAEDFAGNTAGAEVSYTVFDDTATDPDFGFGGFTGPIAGPPTVNLVTANQVVAVKFSLGGDFGPDIFKEGYPLSRQIGGCDTGGDPHDADEASSVGGSGLSYDHETGEYTFRWRTMRNWRGSCRELVLKFVDDPTDAEYIARFQFRR
jgi:hypothetical protein